MLEVITFMIGFLLILVGLASILSPFPVGWILISSGLLLLITVSVRVREFTKREMVKHPKIEKRLPKRVKDLLNKGKK